MVLLAGAVAALVVAVDRQPVVSGPAYAEALQLTDAVAAPLAADGVNGEAEVIARFRALWGDLTVEGVDRLIDQVYAADVWFNDTVKTITGRDALHHYLQETAARVDACRVEIDDIARSGTHYYVRWRMSVVPAGSAADRPWESIGVTHLRFNADGQIVLHQDYWDSSAGLYEHFPVVGWMIRNIKARL